MFHVIRFLHRGLPGHGVANDGYTAKELDANKGNRFQAINYLNMVLNADQARFLPGILKNFLQD